MRTIMMTVDCKRPEKRTEASPSNDSHQRGDATRKMHYFSPCLDLNCVVLFDKELTLKFTGILLSDQILENTTLNCLEGT